MGKDDSYLSGYVGHGGDGHFAQLGALHRQQEQDKAKLDRQIAEWNKPRPTSQPSRKPPSSKSVGSGSASGGRSSGATASVSASSSEGMSFEGFLSLADWIAVPVEEWLSRTVSRKTFYTVFTIVGVVFLVASLFMFPISLLNLSLAFLFGAISLPISYLALRLAISAATFAVMFVLGILLLFAGLGALFYIGKLALSFWS